VPIALALYLTASLVPTICCALSLRKKHKDTRTFSELYLLYYLYFVISYLLLFLCCHLTNKVAYIHIYDTIGEKNRYHEWKKLEAFKFREIASNDAKHGALEKCLTFNINKIMQYFVTNYQVSFETSMC